MVFTSKSRVNYNPNATNVVIQNPDGTLWDIETWMADLSDDPNIVTVLWQILGAIVRPNVRWDKSAWFYSETGNNGKGTLCSLMRNLCGEGTHASIKLSDFGKDFVLEPLIHSSAIIVDENDVGTFVDKTASLKAIITNDVIQINRKFKPPVDFQFHGFMVQCLNEMPRIKDKSNSFYRRQLFIPFEKCFAGHERKYIKDDYLKRPEVLEYVLMRVITMPNYYELNEPESCKQVLEEYKTFNDPVRSFCENILPQCKWDLLPYDFLYDLYVAWFKHEYPSGVLQCKNTFRGDVQRYILNNNIGWRLPYRTSDNKERPMRSKGRMDTPEPLIWRYEVTSWYNKSYTGHDPNRICMPSLDVMYRGLIRSPTCNPGDNNDDNDNNG